MKRQIYIALFVLLGILLQFLLHALLEMGMISLLLGDFDRYSLGLSWRQWYQVHGVASIVLLVAGAWFGYRQGMYWWRVIYVEQRQKNWKWWPK